jgi:carbon-monoxide dehydrogenase medium subunit
MYPAPIEKYHRPKSAEEARQAAIDAQGEYMYFAGGMSLMQAMKSRMISPDCVIDLNDIDELKGISTTDDIIRIGAMTRYRDIAEKAAALGPFQALSDAAANVGDRQVRNRGTLGGSLAWNHYHACSPIAALACGASVNILRSSGTSETVAIDDFLLGALTTDLDDADLLLSVDLAPPDAAAASAYRKWGIVKDAVPVIGVGVFLELDSSGLCARARFAVGGLATGPQRSPDAEARLTGGLDLDDTAALRSCAAAAAAQIETESDPWISADYKNHLIERLGTEMLLKAVQRARGAENA